MAVEISPAVLETYDFRHQPKNHLLIRAAGLRARARKVQQKLARPSEVSTQGFALGSGLETQADHFREHGWAFIEDFLSPETHQAVIDGWPSRSFFDPMRNILKSYDFGFKWVGKTPPPSTLTEFPAILSVYEMLRTDEVARRVSEFAGDGIERTCYSSLLSWATGGSSLIPHLDTVAQDDAGAAFINVIMFIDGTGGPRAGGTCIIADNEYENVLFEPHDLRNTALIYRSGDQRFFHGFKPMRAGTYRWAMNAEYAPPENKFAV